MNVYPQTGIPHYARSFISVGDVLVAIYDSLRNLVPPEEWNIAPRRFREQVKKAYRRRIDAFSPLTIKAIEEKKGQYLLRIDYLLDMTMFAGLERRDSEKRDDLIRNDGVTTFFMRLEPRSD